MTTDPTPCPTCAGPSQPDHLAGLLGGWHHNPGCPLLAPEDARAIADLDMLTYGWFSRYATDTERTLLAALGYTWLPRAEPLRTNVSRATPSQRARTWPDATQTTT